jgi:hypothetical protein
MQKIKKTICPGCGKIIEKKENDFIFDVIQGNTSENLILQNDNLIHGIEYCAICR